MAIRHIVNMSDSFQWAFLSSKASWTEKPGGFWSIGSQGVGHDWSYVPCMQYSSALRCCRSGAGRAFLCDVVQLMDHAEGTLSKALWAACPPLGRSEMMPVVSSFRTRSSSPWISEGRCHFPFYQLSSPPLPLLLLLTVFSWGLNIHQLSYIEAGPILLLLFQLRGIYCLALFQVSTTS